MAKTKQRQTEKEPAKEVEKQQIISQADDKTTIDDIETKKKQKEELPEGFNKRLPAGVKRKLRVVADKLSKENGKVFRIEDTTTGKITIHRRVKIEGDSDLVHEVEKQGCRTHGSAHIETEASILVGN